MNKVRRFDLIKEQHASINRYRLAPIKLAGLLYDEYRRLCEQTGEKPMDARAWFNELVERAPRP